MRLRTLLGVVFTILFAGIVARSVFVATALARLSEGARRALESREGLDDAVARTGGLAIDLETGVRGYSLTRDPSFREPYDAAMRVQASVLAALATHAGGDAASATVAARISSALGEWDRVVARPLLSGSSSDLERALHVDGKRRMDSVRRDLDALRVLASARQRAELDRLEARRREIASETWITGAAFLAVLCAAWVFSRRRIERPIAALAAYADTIAAGLDPGARDAVHGVREIDGLADSLDRMLERLAHRRAQLATTLDSLAEAVFLFDGEGVCRLANPAARTLLGADVAGKTVAELRASFLPGVEAPPGPPSDPVGAPLGALQRITDASGAKKTLLVNVRSVRDRDEVIGMVVSAHDVTAETELREAVDAAYEELQAQNEELQAQDEELRVQSEELVRRNEELARASRLKTEFLATMSHELRTPLNAVIGFSELLVSGTYGPLADKQRAVVSDVNAAGVHLLALIDDLLDLSKVEAGHLALDLEPFAIASAIDEAITFVAPVAERKAIRIAVRVPEELVVRGDRSRVRQVALNLVSNAVKFTPEGGSVAIEARAEGETIRVEVHDTGIGIRASDVARLFQPFSQLDTGDGRRFGGTGLGLSISKRLVERMRGEIGHAARAHGSTFWFTLPRASGATVTATRAPSGPAARPPKVLVVEDVEADATIVETVLSGSGYAVRVVSSAERALVELEGEPPALLLVDLGLPGMSGLALVERVSAIPRLSDVPVAILSTRDLSGEERARLGARVRLVLRKGGPSRTELLDRIAEIVAPAAPRARRSVLVVDDNDVNRRVARAMVEALGHEVFEAAGGEEAVRIAGERRPDAILMDIQMPGMDGLSALRELRASALTATIPVIAVTAHAMTGDAERFLAAGCVGYVPKPIARARLADALGRALGEGPS